MRNEQNDAQHADGNGRSHSRPGAAQRMPAVAGAAGGTGSPPSPSVAPASPASEGITLPRSLTVRELGGKLGVSPIAVIKALMKNGIMATISQELDYETAAIVAHDLNIEVHEERPAAPAVAEPVVEPVVELAPESAPQSTVAPPATTTLEDLGIVAEPAIEEPVPVYEEPPLVDVADDVVELDEPEPVLLPPKPKHRRQRPTKAPAAAPAASAVAVAEPEVETEDDLAEPEEAPEPEELLRPRPPVVTVMGHVDHGKTLLLDTIRSTNVVASEAGGITQHIGAYQAEQDGHRITFIDTPGHAAFTAMRARGAQVTDIAVIVVAANEGVMPQTLEAISHARAANVPIIVALNKIDLAEANPDRVKAELAEAGLALVEWGGDVELVPVSARTGDGIDGLLETIQLTAELSHDGKGVRANPDRPAFGTVIEARMDRQRGPIANIIVQQGTLKVGQFVVAGSVVGKVRAMFNDRGQQVKEAPPAMPVSVLGLAEVPAAGDRLQVFANEKEARAIAAERAMRKRVRALPAQRPGVMPGARLEDLFAQMQKTSSNELNLVIKADVQGTLEAIRGALEDLGEDVPRTLKIIHDGVGQVTESDVLLASASNALVIGFNVAPDASARRTADVEHVEIRHYNIIYKLTEDLDALLRGSTEPVYAEVVQGHAEVRQVFRIGRSAVAGGYVTDGRITRNSSVRVIRTNDVIWTGGISSLKRFKDDVREVSAGYEFGISLDGFSDYQEGDVLESFAQERTA